jgi:uncharacterized protein YjbJ (UPF0337 family)
MNKNRAKGTIDEVVGSAKRKAGELTGNAHLQIEGMAQQVKGKVENAWGKAKDVVQEANEETARQHETHVEVERSAAVARPDKNK